MKTKGFALLVLLFLLTAYTAGAEELWYPQMPEEMPVISIETMDGSNHFADAYMRDHKLQGLIHYVDALITVEGTDVQAEKAQVKARGNYTLEYPQKSIRIKFENKQSMLGLNEGQAYKSWVLLAEWKDLSRLHSPIGLFLAPVRISPKKEAPFSVLCSHTLRLPKRTVIPRERITGILPAPILYFHCFSSNAFSPIKLVVRPDR